MLSQDGAECEKIPANDFFFVGRVGPYSPPPLGEGVRLGGYPRGVFSLIVATKSRKKIGPQN